MLTGCLGDGESKMTYRGYVHNGVVVFESPLTPPEGSTVEITIVTAATKTAMSEGSLYDSLKDVVGIVDDMPADSSINIDHYLYGTPAK